jgi:hypothetical protein|tara:strand:- start:287 stop:640 length:354 start_codon:yes stop_codon:yes gene_type:complete
MLKKIFIYLLSISIFTGCSNSSKDIVAQYVSPQQYSNYDCDQLRAELTRVSGKVRSITGKLDKNNENDKVATGIALVLFWPSVFFLGGTKEEEADYARLKGEYDALEQSSILKKCSM